MEYQSGERVYYKGDLARVIAVDGSSSSLQILRDRDEVGREVNVPLESKNVRTVLHSVIYWEKQSRAFCGVHAVNNILQVGVTETCHVSCIASKH